MASVNKVILIGNLGRDPEVRYAPNSNLAIANVTIATSSTWNDKNTGDRREETEWHRVVFYGRQAEVVEQFLRKGSSVYVEGRIKTRKWTDKDGQDRYTTEIIAEQMQMLGGRQENEKTEGIPDWMDDENVVTNQAKAPSVSRSTVKSTPDSNDDFDDDIPF